MDIIAAAFRAGAQLRDDMNELVTAFSALTLVDSFRILDLPAELISNVCEYLDDRDLISLRKVCRSLADSSVHSFGTRSFKYLVVILHPTSLAVLLEIANHPQFSKYVHSIGISSEYVNSEIEEEDPSGLLTGVLQNLPNLKVIWVGDLRSFAKVNDLPSCCYEYTSHSLRCGRTYLDRRVDFRSYTRSFDSLERAINIVMDTIETGRVHDRVTVNFKTRPHYDRDADANEREETLPALEGDFDFTSKHWQWQKSSFARVQQVDAEFCLECPYPWWLEDCLALMEGLLELSISSGHTSIVNLYSATGTLLTWPKLSSLAIDYSYMEHACISEFLTAHRKSLSSIRLLDVALDDGTWEEPFEIIRSMRQLKHLTLRRLAQRTPFNPFCNVPISCGLDMIECDDATSITLALDVLLSDPRTTFCITPRSGWYFIDCRVANAAVEGKVECCDGEWKFRD